MAKIKTIHQQVISNNAPTAETEMHLLKVECNKLSVDRAAASSIRLNQTFYKEREKTGKLLTWQIKQLETRKK